MNSSEILRIFIYVLYFAYKLTECCTDFIFIIDGSADLKPKFQNIIDIANEVASGLNLDKQQHRVAILEFGSVARVAQWQKYRFGQINTETKLKNTISKLPSLQGVSDKAKVFEIIEKQFIPGRQENSPLVIFTITDGQFRSRNEKKNVSQLVSELASLENVHFFAATTTVDHNLPGMSTFTNGDGSKVASGKDTISQSRSFLQPFIACLKGVNPVSRKIQSSSSKITVAPESARVFKGPPSSETLSGTNQQKSRATTSRSPIVKPGCLLDIVFLMDFSGGVTDKRESYLELASSLVEELHLGSDGAQVGMVRYSGPGRTETVFHLNKHMDVTAAIREMKAAGHMGGTTRTGEAILYTIGEFTEKKGGRKNANKLLIVFTDGYSQDDPADAAQLARKSGINIHTVAIEDDDVPPNKSQLNEIAGNAKDVYISSEFNRLRSQIMNQQRRCR